MYTVQTVSYFLVDRRRLLLQCLSSPIKDNEALETCELSP